MFVTLTDEAMHEVYAYDEDRGVGITYCGQFVGPYDTELGPPANCPLCLTISLKSRILDQEAVFGLVKAAATERRIP